jgi:Flp pilus assembly pilin Flp
MIQMILNLIAKANELAMKLYCNTSTPVLATVTNRRRRGATFIEYALLAGLAVVLFLAIRGPLQGVIQNAIDKLNGARN